MNTETTDQTLRRLIRLALEEIKGEADLRALKNTDAAEYATDKELIKHLQADAYGSAKTVAALRAEVAAYRVEADEQRNEAAKAEARLLEIATVIRNHSFGITEQAHSALSVALYKNSI